MALRAAIYARCSTEEESQRHALAAQVEEARECVRQQGWILADEYVESQSGTSTKKRREYMRLYENLKSDIFDVIVIKSQDRLMRNTKDWYLFVDRLTAGGKRLYIYLERRFYTPDDALLTGIKAILAEEYSRELSRKINHAHRHRQQNNGTVLITSNAYGFRKLPDKSVVLVEEEAEIKRKMYRMCAEGMGSRTIAGKLREEGIVKRSGKPFTKNDILRIIHNPMNKGTVVMNRTHYDFESRRIFQVPKEEHYVYEDKIPATVTEKLWKEANDSIRRRTGNRGTGEIKGKNQGKYPLSGKLYCSLCGCPYYRTTRRGGRGDVKVHEWRCRTYQEQGREGCVGIRLEERELYRLLGHLCEEQSVQKREQRIEKVMECVQKGLAGNEKNGNLKYYHQVIEETEEQMQRLLDKLLGNVITDIVYQKKQRELEVSLKNAKTKAMTIRREEQRPEPEKIREIEKRLREGRYIEQALTEQMLDKVEKIKVCSFGLELYFCHEQKNKGRDKREEECVQIPYGTDAGKSCGKK